MKTNFWKRICAAAFSAVLLFGTSLQTHAAYNAYPQVDAYQNVSTLKGQQTYIDNSDYNYGSQHAFHNFMINRAYNPSASPNFYFEGKGYNFRDYDWYISWIKARNNAGQTVNIQFMIEWDDSKLVLIDESARSKVDSPYYAPATTGEGKQILRAFWAWLMSSLADADAHIDNIILGNEVNMPNHWHYSGGAGIQASAQKYASAFYDMREIVRRFTDKTRVSVCVDHSWNDNDQGRGFAVRDFLGYFNSSLADLNNGEKVDDWCISMHLYPAVLYETEIWLDRVAPGLNALSDSSRFVDGKNLSYITNYIKSNFGENHRIMMTEQGFAMYRGEDQQAASLAYSYYACKYDSMVDSFIITINSSTDSRFDYKIKDRVAEYVYKNIDDPAHEANIARAMLSVIGADSWSDIIPHYGETIVRKQYVGSGYESRPNYYDGVDYSAVFDFDYYAEHNTDVADTWGRDLLLHFVKYGMAEGRQAKADFNVYNYKENNPDLNFGDDLKTYYLHYIKYGKAEGRSGNVIHTTGISLNKTGEIDLDAGKAIELEATVTPANATNKNVIWTSSDETVAKVNANGRVAGMSNGTAIITAVTQDGNYTASVIVKVTELEEDALMVQNATTFRLYNPNSGEHFYTGSPAERNNLVAAGWNYEGAGWNAVGVSDKPVYRLYNEIAGDHHYTMDEGEMNMLKAAGWNLEGIGWYSADEEGMPMYRLYNPNATSGSHHYTASEEERDSLKNMGWIYEGIGWYGRN